MSTWAESDAGTRAAAYTAAVPTLSATAQPFDRCTPRLLETLAPDAAIGGGQADRMATITEEWTDVAAIFRDAEGAEPALDEAASVAQEIAEQERTFFKGVREAL